MRSQVRGYEVISDKYHTDNRKCKEEKQERTESEQKYIEEIKELTRQLKEKELQLKVAIHALKVNEKQLKDQEQDQTEKETQYTQRIESLNQLLKDTEETTQHQVESLKAEIQKLQQGKLDAEYSTAEVREQLQETKEELKEVKQDRLQAWDDIKELREQISTDEDTRGELIEKITGLYEQLQNCHIQLDYLKSLQPVITDPKVSVTANTSHQKLLTGSTNPKTEYSPGTDVKRPARFSRHWNSEPDLSETYISKNIGFEEDEYREGGIGLTDQGSLGDSETNLLENSEGDRPEIGNLFEELMMDQMKFLQKIQQPKEFEGKAHQSGKEFLRQFEAFCGAAGQEPDDERNPPAKSKRFANAFAALLQGAALVWFESLPTDVRQDYVLLKKAFIKRFVDPFIKGHCLTQETLLRSRKLKENETVETLYQALAELCQQMGKDEDELMNILIQALPAQPYRTTIMAANPQNLTDALQIAKGVEAMNLQPDAGRCRKQTDMYTMMSELSITDDIEQYKEEMRQQMEAQEAKMAALESKLNSKSQRDKGEVTDQERKMT